MPKGHVELASRASQSSPPAASDLVFLLIDLDHFKSVNDTYGHPAGDAVLKQTADVLRDAFRAGDYLVRWGGEEFLIVVRFIDRMRAPELAEKARAAIASHEFRLPDGTALHRTCSIGFASFPPSQSEPPALTWEDIVKLADAALYEAKRGGRNRAIGLQPATADFADSRGLNARGGGQKESARSNPRLISKSACLLIVRFASFYADRRSIGRYHDLER